MKVVLYSTHCPRCDVLEEKLNNAHIDFEEVNDVDVMMQKGFTHAPVLEVDGTIMDFKEAVNWVNTLK